MASRSEPPWYYAVDARPVKLLRTAEGQIEVLVFDYGSGELRPDPAYLQRCLAPAGDVIELDEATFHSRVKSLRAQVGVAIEGSPPTSLRIAHFRDSRRVLEIDLRSGAYEI